MRLGLKTDTDGAEWRGRVLVLALVLVCAVSSAPLARAQGVVQKVRRGSVELSVGEVHGVRLGMRCTIVVVDEFAGREKRSPVASLEITEVHSDWSVAGIVRLERGRKIAPGLEVEFDHPLQGMPTTRPGEPSEGQDESPMPVAGSMASAAKSSRPSGRPDRATPNVDDTERAVRAAIARRDWDTTLELLKPFAYGETRQGLVIEGIRWKYREARGELERGNLAAAREACEQGLQLQRDGDLVSLLGEIAYVEFLEEFRPVVERANALNERIRAFERTAWDADTERRNADLADLRARRDTTLDELIDALTRPERKPGDLIVKTTQQLLRGPMISVPRSVFTMGCTEGDTRCRDNELPPRRVTVEAFFLDATEVTVRQYTAFVRATGSRLLDSTSFLQGGDHPAVNVSWEDAKDYCEWVGGRLPTEAEWELAARAGTTDRRYPMGNEIDHSDANFVGVEGDDAWSATSPVCSFPPNPWGFCDLVGNVWEWCDDRYTPTLDKAPGHRDLDEAFSLVRVIRGGSWIAERQHLRFSARQWYAPDFAMFNVGFRCAADGDPTPEGGAS